MKLKRFYAIDGARIALIGDQQRIYTRMVYIDSPMKLHKVPNGDVTRYTTDVAGKVKPAIRKMLKAGKRLGITKGAKKFLRAGLK